MKRMSRVRGGKTAGVLAGLLLLCLVAAGCGGSDDGDDAAEATQAEETQAEETAATDEEAESADEPTDEPADTDSTEAEDAATDATEEESAGADGGAGTPAPQPLAERTEVTMLYTADVLVFAAPLLANYFDEFEAENLDVTLEIVPPADGVVLLTQDRADLMMTGVNPGHLSLFMEGAPIRYVAGNLGEPLPETESVYMRKELLDEDGNPDLDRIPGTTWMVSIGGGGGFGASGALPSYRWLTSNGVDPSTINAQNSPSMGDTALGLINGQFDAALVLSPAWEDVVESDCCIRLDGTIAADGVYVANTRFLEEDAEVAEAVFRAIMRTHRTYLQGDYLEDPEVVTALSEVLGQPEDGIRTLPPMRFSTDLNIETIEPLIPEYEAMFRFSGLIEYEGNVTLEQAIDTSPVDAVLASE